MSQASPGNESANELALLLRAGHRLIAVETFEEERGLRLIGRVAKAAGRALHVWSLAGGWDAGGQGAGSLNAGLVHALTLATEPALLVLLDPGKLLDDPIVRRRLRDALPAFAQRRQSIALLGAVVDLPAELEREAGRVALPLPTADELRNLFERALASGPRMDSEQLDDCVRAALGLTGAEAVRVLRKATLAASGADEAARRIAREKEKALRRTPALCFYDPSEGLTDVGGLSELKRWLRERRRAFGEDARSFGLPAPRGLLLLGVQGCGKSLCAKAVAREWGFPLLRLDLAAAFGDPARGPELVVREATTVAESLSPVVLWIDEIEKGFSSLDGDSGASRTFGSFLTWMAEKRAPVFVVATANDVTRLPPELLRRGRFDELFFVDLPDANERAEILAIHVRKQGRDPAQLPLEELAHEAERLSGAELEQVVAAGLYTAFAAGRDLDETDLARAIRETVPLYETYEERIKELRNWARTRARQASLDARLIDLFPGRTEP